MKKLLFTLSTFISTGAVMGQGTVVNFWDFETNDAGWTSVDLGEQNRTFTRGLNASFNSESVVVPQNPGSSYIMGYNDDAFGDDEVEVDVYMWSDFADYSMYDSLEIFFDYYNTEDDYYSSYFYFNTGGDHNNLDESYYIELEPTNVWLSTVVKVLPEDFEAGYLANMSFGFNYYDAAYWEYGLFIDNVKIVGYKSDDDLANAKVDAFKLAMYPNPTKDVLLIDASSQLVENVTIIDQNGRVVTSIDVNEVAPSISVENLTEGLYFVQVTSNGSTVTKKMSKQ